MRSCCTTCRCMLTHLSGPDTCLKRRHCRADAVEKECRISVQQHAASSPTMRMRTAGGYVAAAEALGGGEHASWHRSRWAAEDATGAAECSSAEHQPAVLRGEARSGGKGRVVHWGWPRCFA